MYRDNKIGTIDPDRIGQAVDGDFIGIYMVASPYIIIYIICRMVLHQVIRIVVEHGTIDVQGISFREQGEIGALRQTSHRREEKSSYSDILFERRGHKILLGMHIFMCIINKKDKKSIIP
jgi:hypothetical protein